MTGAVTWETLIFITTVVGGTIGLALWIFKIIANLRKEITDHKLYAAENYVTKNSLRNEMQALRESLDNLSTRIDRVLEK